MDRKEQYALLLLAGGKSLRMGKNKATLILEGHTFAENLIEKSKQLGIEKAYVSGYDMDREDVSVIWDIYPDRGPLGGLHACMKEMSQPYSLVLPTDVPQIPTELLDKMMIYHEKMEDKRKPLILQHNGRTENLIGIYPTKMCDFIGNLIEKESVSVRFLLEKWGYECFLADIPRWHAENINTVDTYQEIQKIFR